MAELAIAIVLFVAAACFERAAGQICEPPTDEEFRAAVEFEKQEWERKVDYANVR